MRRGDATRPWGEFALSLPVHFFRLLPVFCARFGCQPLDEASALTGFVEFAAWEATELSSATSKAVGFDQSMVRVPNERLVLCKASKPFSVTDSVTGSSPMRVSARYGPISSADCRRNL